MIEPDWDAVLGLGTGHKVCVLGGGGISTIEKILP